MMAMDPMMQVRAAADAINQSDPNGYNYRGGGRDYRGGGRGGYRGGFNGPPPQGDRFPPSQGDRFPPSHGDRFPPQGPNSQGDGGYYPMHNEMYQPMRGRGRGGYDRGGPRRGFSRGGGGGRDYY